MCGQEWVVEALGCDAASLRDPAKLRELFARLTEDLALRQVGEGWHQFPNTGGVTGLWMLAESHLTCHTFPEYGSLCLNLFCCRPRQDPDFAAYLAVAFGASEVRVRRLDRPYQP